MSQSSLPRKSSRWIWWTLAGIGVPVLLLLYLFSDEPLNSASHLMPSRQAKPYAAGSAWSKFAAFSASLPPRTKDTKLLSMKEAAGPPTGSDALKPYSLTEPQWQELEAILALPDWHEPHQPPEALKDMMNLYWHLSASAVHAIEHGDSATWLRVFKFSAALGRHYVSSGTSAMHFLFGTSLPGYETTARAVTYLPLSAEQLNEVASQLSADPFESEDYLEALKFNFLEERAQIESVDVPEEIESKRWQQVFYQKNATLNLHLRFTEEALGVALGAPYEEVNRLVARQAGEVERHEAWWNPNRMGYKHLAYLGAALESGIRSRLAVHRALRVVVAMHRYHFAHGSLPASASDLVPAFLHAAPADPFDFKPLRWDSAGRLVYSIGKSLKPGPPAKSGFNPDSSGYWPLVSLHGFDSPLVRFRLKTDGPDVVPSPKSPAKSPAAKNP